MDAALFDRLKQLKLPPGDYAVFGSGPLAVRGIIPVCGDLDVLCRREAWEIVCSIGKIEFLPEYGFSIVAMSNAAVTFGTQWGIGDFDTNELIDSAEIIDGLPFVRL